MEYTKEIRINIPEGCAIDTDKSDLSTGTIVFKRTDETWDDISDSFPLTDDIYFIKRHPYISSDTKGCINRVIASTKLTYIAKYLNGYWKPGMSNEKWYITAAGDVLCQKGIYNIGTVYFKDKESCKKAVRIMGDELKYLM